jgi:hypothetical protein
MIEDSIKTLLKDKYFEPILEFMENSGIDFRNKRLNGPLGVATYYCVFIDLVRLTNGFNNNLIAYIILHEVGHYKRIAKMGKEGIIKNLSLEDFNEFCKFVINEEIVADRYSSFVVYLLTKELYPREATQQLHREDRQKRYKHSVRTLFGIVKNNEENYKGLLERFVV